MPIQETQIKDLELRFERRRYGNKWFCWVEAKHYRQHPDTLELESTWVSLGDPWSCKTPKTSEIEESARHERICTLAKLETTSCR